MRMSTCARQRYVGTAAHATKSRFAPSEVGLGMPRVRMASVAQHWRELQNAFFQSSSTTQTGPVRRAGPTRARKRHGTGALVCRACPPFEGRRISFAPLSPP